MLAAMGADGGLCIAHWTAPVLASFFPSGPLAVTLTGTVLAFATLLALGASVLFEQAPAHSMPVASMSWRRSGRRVTAPTGAVVPLA